MQIPARSRPPSVTILYHFFPPDDVVSSRHFGDFAGELARDGWKVTVLTSNRYCRYPRRKIAKREEDWEGVRVIREGRPGLNQAGNISRLVNSLVLMLRWFLRLMKLPKSDVLVLGTDPQFVGLLFPLLRVFKRASCLCQWCFDVYPDAIVADSHNPVIRFMAKAACPVVRWAYKHVDLVVDIGPCMRKRLARYRNGADCATLTPWALTEPEEVGRAEPGVREALFGEETELGLLYSGNLGKAHEFRELLELARYIRKRNPRIVFCFACRGNKTDELRGSIKPSDTNVRITEFAAEKDLRKRLASADIHLLSLRNHWEGIVVPSKLFGSMAVGRPILFEGPENSEIAQWIREFDIGMVVTPENRRKVAERLLQYAKDGKELNRWKENAFRAYNHHFSKRKVMEGWEQVLSAELKVHTGWEAVWRPGKVKERTPVPAAEPVAERETEPARELVEAG